MKNKFLNFKSLILIITLAFTINFLNISANADSDIPDPSELLYVTDNANILSDETKNYLVKQNETLYEATGAQIAILTIDAIPNGYDSETYSYTVLDHWGVGSSEKNNGVVILLVPGEGKFWIAQGAGLDKTLSSYVLNKIIDKDLANDFDSGDYDKAVTNTFNSIVKLINKSYSSTENKVKPKNDLNTSKKSTTDSLIPIRSQLMLVTDNADVLSDSDIRYVITKNEKFAETSNAEISVLTIENLPEGYDIETYAYKVFYEWGMNSKEKNNGVLLLIVSGENKTFIATGSGLKSSLTNSPGYSSIEKNFATSLNTYSNKYRISSVVLSLAININNIDKNNSYDTITTKVLYYLFGLLIILIFILPVIFFFSVFLKAVSKSSSCKNSMKKATVKITSSTKEPTSSTNETISSGDKAVDVIISEGLAYLRQIKQANDAITDEKISVQITRMEVATDKIFRYIAKHPEDAPQIHKFMNYYLPTLLKLLDSYISLNEQGIKGEHISSTIKNIEGILSTIADAFEKQLDNLFADDALDISTDIKVLETMLAQEGLTSDGFKK